MDKYCGNCGNKINQGEKFCGSCGKAVNSMQPKQNNNNKMPIGVKIILITFGVILIGSIINSSFEDDSKEYSNSTTKGVQTTQSTTTNDSVTTTVKPTTTKSTMTKITTTTTTKPTTTTKKIDKSIIYDKNDILIKFKSYECGWIIDSMTIYVYIENNSDKPIKLYFDGRAVIDGYSLEQIFYEEIMPHTKGNYDLDIYGFQDNKLKCKDVENLTLYLNMYNSKTYKDIEKNKIVNYSFK